MRARRYIFWALMPIVLYLGLYTGLRIFYIIFFIQILLLALGIALAYYTINNFKFTQTIESTRAVKGSKTKLTIDITNETIIPLSMMDVTVALAIPGREQMVSLCIAPFSKESFEIDLDLPYRGVYNVGMKEIKITDVFGITCIKYDMQKLSWYEMSTLTVVPRSPSSYSAKEILDEKLFGDVLTTPASSGDSVAGAREYAQGDPLKRVNWKVSARYGELFVKEYDIPARENVVILLDLAEYKPKEVKKKLLRKKEKFDENLEIAAAKSDTICECAAAIAKMSLLRGKNSEMFELNCSDLSNTITVSSDADTENMLMWLAGIEFEAKGRFDKVVSSFADRNEASSLIFITSDERSDASSRLEKYTSVFDSIGVIGVGFYPQQTGRVGVLSVPVSADVSALFTQEVK